MTWYGYIRFFFIPIAFVVWVLVQLLLKKKPWTSIKGDILVSSLFVVAVMGVFYWLSN
jgi:hypothetical protein